MPNAFHHPPFGGREKVGMRRAAALVCHIVSLANEPAIFPPLTGRET
jgi:hypothetical protein